MTSRLDKIIERVERGEPIDYEREATLIALETVREGQRFLDDMIAREITADDHFEQFDPRR